MILIVGSILLFSLMIIKSNFFFSRMYAFDKMSWSSLIWFINKLISLELLSDSAYLFLMLFTVEYLGAPDIDGLKYLS